MPGIAGIISRNPAQHFERTVRSMLETMMHERFYNTGTLFLPAAGIYCGWVTHPGSFADSNSGSNCRGDISVAFAGECFDDGMASLAPRSNDQNADSSKTIVRRYEQYGNKFVDSLNGIFSGLLVDHNNKRAILVNDRYSAERIYYHEDQEAIYFASEAKALLRVLPQLRKFDDEGTRQFLAFGCTLESRTLFRGISLLPGGTRWSFDSGRPTRPENYLNPVQLELQPSLTEQEYCDEFSAVFSRILPRYCNTNDTLGISLTGGLDSRMIMACLPQTNPAATSYTFAGRSKNLLDARIAAKVASACGLKHQIIKIGNDFLENFGTYVDRTVYITDGCAGALGAHEIYLNAQAREIAHIRLTGNFGSEILRAASTFKPLQLDSALFTSEWARRVALADDIKVYSTVHPVTFSAFKEMPWNLFGTLAAGRSQLTFRTPYLDNDLVALAYRAPLDRRQSPRAAMQLIRKARPVLAAIPTDRGQKYGPKGPSWLLRRLFAEFTFKIDYMHKEGLPSALSSFGPLLDSLDRTGFLGQHKFLAFRRWFQSDVLQHIARVVTDENTVKMPYWNATFLKKMLPEHASGRKNYVREINAVLTLEAVDRLLLRSNVSNS